jgi:choline dehydrogenase-like flavoprotein
MTPVTAQQVEGLLYDVVIVGGGFVGAVIAHALTGSGLSVLMLEAGEGRIDDFTQHLGYLDTFMAATIKIPQSPFPTSLNAPQPLETEFGVIPSGGLDKGYFFQLGPRPFGSTYTKRLGGTTLHWFGSCPRMLPEDFEMQSRFGRGVDWPIGYDDLMPYYARAERVVGVSADVADQTFHGIRFEPGYGYPMRRIPPSYLDNWIASRLSGMVEETADGPVVPTVNSIPQARNSLANPDYDGGRGYQPVGADGNGGAGERCMGNANCLPICPIQARFNALKLLSRAKGDLLTRAVASKLEIDPVSGRITAVNCKVWHSDDSPEHLDVRVTGKLTVLAANAIENAMLLQASGACTSSEMVGRNLMDHPAILNWGMAPRATGAFRGPGLTSVIPTYRGGAFRKDRAGHVVEIGNWGWSWPFNEPSRTTQALVDDENLHGADLRAALGDRISRQVRFDMMTEQLPDPSNRVTIDPAKRDRMGNYRPVIRYDVDGYTRDGLVAGRRFAKRVFDKIGVKDCTKDDPGSPGYFEQDGQPYSWAGVGHIAGTHCMGTSAKTSVVDRLQRAWDHDNLFVVGCGSMPTLGTSNPSITMTAMALMTADHIRSGSAR